MTLRNFFPQWCHQRWPSEAFIITIIIKTVSLSGISSSLHLSLLLLMPLCFSLTHASIIQLSYNLKAKFWKVAKWMETVSSAVSLQNVWIIQQKNKTKKLSRLHMKWHEILRKFIYMCFFYSAFSARCSRITMRGKRPMSLSLISEC